MLHSPIMEISLVIDASITNKLVVTFYGISQYTWYVCDIISSWPTFSPNFFIAQTVTKRQKQNLAQNPPIDPKLPTAYDVVFEIVVNR